MNCATHPANNAASYCRTCGKAMCERCERPIRGVVYCEDCVAASMQGTPAAAPPPASCAQHPGTPPSSFCRTCGKPICRECERSVRGVVYCEDCLAGKVHGAPAAPTAAGGRRSGPRVGIAALLSVIMPFGVAQAYLGQYARGLVHLVVFCVLIWGADRGAGWPFFGIGIAAFIAYQLIDAIRSAQHMAAGMPAPDPFGLDNLLGPKFNVPSSWPQAGNPAPYAGAAPAAPAAAFTAAATAAPPPTPAPEPSTGSPTSAIVLIGLGIVFLLGRSGIRLFWMGSVWPFILIVIGAALLVRHWEDITVRRRSLMGPAVLLTLGTLFTVQTMRHVNFGRTFPILLIVIGAVLVWQRSCCPARPSDPPRNEPPPTEPPSAPVSGAQLGTGAGSNPESEVKGS